MTPFLHEIDTLVIHHSASPNGTRIETIREWHIERGWDDIGYHRVIELSGQIRDGRDLRFMGAHVYGDNDHTLGICLPGNNKRAGCEWTGRQVDSLRQLVAWTRAINPRIRVVGHNELAETDCPGVVLSDVLKET